MHRAYAHHLEARGLAPRTITEYVRMITRADKHVRVHAGRPIEAALPQDVYAWAESLPFSWATRKQARTALAHWQAFAHHPHDLAAAVRVPRKPKMVCRAPEDHEVAAIEAAAHRAGRRGLAVLLGLYLGMRVSEIAAASWTGYDGATWTWQRVKGGKVASKPVAPRLAEALDRHEQWGPWVFPSAHHPHVRPATVWGWVRRIGASVGVPLSPHMLRHASIEKVVREHGIRVGQEWADHEDPATTSGYSRVSQRQMQEAASSLAW